jgi:hypothetical protein
MMALTPFSIWWSVTRKVGFAAYFGTGLSCGFVWLRFRRKFRRGMGIAGLALLLAMIEFVLALDIVFERRLALHSFCGNLFMKYNLYDRRHPIQAMSLLALGSALVFTASRVFRRYRGRTGVLLAASGAGMSITLWLVEIISMHEIDAALYHQVSDVMVIALLWVLACGLTLLGAGIEARRAAGES